MLRWVLWISRDTFRTCAVGPRTPSRPVFDPRARYSRTTLSSGRPADTNLDESLESFPEEFLTAYSGKRPECVVTSPPYSRALTFVKAAMSLATKGVVFKMSNSFLEPCADRGGWLQTNPSSMCLFLRRAKYTRAGNAKMGEFWGGSYAQEVSCRNRMRLVFCPEKHGCSFERSMVGCASLASEIFYLNWDI